MAAMTLEPAISILKLPVTTGHAPTLVAMILLLAIMIVMPAVIMGIVFTS